VFEWAGVQQEGQVGSMTCTHKNWTDHTTGVRTPDGGNTWICSHCGAIGEWTDLWSYYGSMECLLAKILERLGAVYHGERTLPYDVKSRAGVQTTLDLWERLQR
jgi:hypothetical protein